MTFEATFHWGLVFGLSFDQTDRTLLIGFGPFAVLLGFRK